MSLDLFLGGGQIDLIQIMLIENYGEFAAEHRPVTRWQSKKLH